MKDNVTTIHSLFSDIPPCFGLNFFVLYFLQVHLKFK